MMSSNINMGPVINNNRYINSVLESCSGKLNVAHLNCRSIRPSTNSTKLFELKSILCGSRVNILGVSETWLKTEVSSRVVKIPGYEFLRHDRSNARGGGVGIYISNGISHRIVFKCMEAGVCESLFVELLSGDMKILFGVVYLPPPGDFAAFEELHSELFSRYFKIVAVGVIVILIVIYLICRSRRQFVQCVSD